MIKKFPYVKEKGRYLPMVPIEIGGIFKTNAIIDSGADISIFRPEIATLLGLNIESGEKIELTGIGSKMAFYKHRVPIIVAGKEINCIAAFSRKFKASVNILGRNNFFHYFIVSFDEIGREIHLDERRFKA